MILTRNRLILLASAGSLALLLGAWGFQHLGGMAPCKMCIWQRWPHGASMALAPVALILGGVLVPLLGALAAAASGVIGVYHTGVERSWWEGPQSCTSGSIEGLSAEELLDQIMAAPIVRCDEVPWELFGVSMASWNALISFGLASIWIVAALKSRA